MAGQQLLYDLKRSVQEFNRFVPVKWRDIVLINVSLDLASKRAHYPWPDRAHQSVPNADLKLA